MMTKKQADEIERILSEWGGTCHPGRKTKENVSIAGMMTGTATQHKTPTARNANSSHQRFTPKTEC